MWTKLQHFLLLSLLFLLPTQLGYHWFAPFSYIHGLRIDYLAPTLYVTDVVCILFLLISYRTLMPLLTRWTLLFLVVIGIHIAFSIEPTLTFYKVIKLLEFIGLFWILFKIKAPHAHFLSIILASSLLQLILAIWQITSQGSIQQAFYLLGERYFTIATPGIAKVSFQGVEILRPYATFSHPNSLGGFYLLIYTFILWKKELKKYMLLRTALLITTSLLVFISFSKIAIITYSIVSVIYAWKYVRKACIFCFAARILILGTVSSLFFIFEGDPESLAKRWKLIQDALVIISQHPFFGTGLGNYLYAQSTFAIPYSYYFLQPVHTIFLLLLAEVGIPLFLLLMFLLINVMKKYRTNSLFIICLFVIGFTGLFDHYSLTLQQNMLLLAVLTAFSLKKDMIK